MKTIVDAADQESPPDHEDWLRVRNWGLRSLRHYMAKRMKDGVRAAQCLGYGGA